MSILNVPHVKQAGITHCGAACLEMVYRYFGAANITQHDIWQKRNTTRPDGTNPYMKTQSIIDDLIDNKFQMLIAQISLEYEKCRGSLKRLLKNKLPIIACKQWRSNPLYGHFVVIIGLEKNTVIYLDPELNSSPQRKDLSNFINEWKTTGVEVIGGQLIIMGKDSNRLRVQRLHATNFNIPKGLKSFCLESVSFQT